MPSVQKQFSCGVLYGTTPSIESWDSPGRGGVMTQCIKANQPLRRGAFLQYTLYNTGWRDKTKPFFKMSVSNLLASIIYPPPCT